MIHTIPFKYKLSQISKNFPIKTKLCVTTYKVGRQNKFLLTLMNCRGLHSIFTIHLRRIIGTCRSTDPSPFKTKLTKHRPNYDELLFPSRG